jgi:hypothetical protein
MPCLDECAIAIERAEVVSIASQADVAVGAYHEQCDALDAEEISGSGFEASDLDGQVGAGPQGNSRFEQRRVRRAIFQGGVEVREGRTGCGWPANEQEGVAGSMGKLVKSTGPRARSPDRDRVG